MSYSDDYEDDYDEEDMSNPLLNAIKNEQYKIAMELIESRTVDVDYINSYGKTALTIVLDVKFQPIKMIELTKLLIERSNVNLIADHILKESPLMIAIKNNHLDFATLIINKEGTDIHVRNYRGDTALIYAVRQCRKDDDYSVIDLLISKGADVNVTSEDGKTLLMYAVDNEDLLRRLLNTNFITNINEIYDSRTVLEMVVINKRNYSLAIDLIRAGADVNICSGHLISNLLSVKYSKTRNFINFLLSLPNLDVERLNSSENTLLWAIKNSWEASLVKKLIELGVDVNDVDFLGRTALMEAARRGMVDVALLLLQNNADWELTCNSGKSFFDYASKDMIRLLPVEKIYNVKGFFQARNNGRSQDIAKLQRYHHNYLIKLGYIPPSDPDSDRDSEALDGKKKKSVKKQRKSVRKQRKSVRKQQKSVRKPRKSSRKKVKSHTKF